MLHDKDIILFDEERLNLWKRPDLSEQRKKIFLCLDEAEHCTFEPKLNKFENTKQLTNEDIINKRISNKAWVGEMGENFSTRFPLVYKEGVLKKAQYVFNEGRFSEAIKILETAFDLDLIKANFDPKYAEIYFKKQEDLQLNRDPNAFVGHEKPKTIIADKFSNPKNKRICEEIYYMLKDMEDYKKERNKQVKKLEQELKMINTVSAGNQTVSKRAPSKDTMNKLSFIKDRYFKFFKSIMCPLKDECKFDQRPKWPHTNIKSYSAFGLTCPYAHHVSELKFV
jgi:tetratricopeptide (TPR) repeat protein